MRKSNLRTPFFLIAVTLCMAAFSVSAFADGGDYYDNERPIETPAVTEQSITPDGNLEPEDRFD